MTHQDDEAFASLRGKLREVQFLQSAHGLLEWDQQTYLPAAGGAYRAEQLGYLAGEIHRRRSDRAILDTLNRLQESTWMLTAGQAEQATVRILNRELTKAARLPQRLVEELATACSLGQQEWVEARRRDDFRRFAPHLATIVRLKREQASAYEMGEVPYDALLDDYEPGASTEAVRRLLDGLLADLVPLVKACVSAAKRRSRNVPSRDILCREYPTAIQEQFGRRVAGAIGFDFESGRLDVTHHPFCTELGPRDVRLLTRYDDRDFATAFFGTLHEAGHGMYEQGLPKTHYGLPPGQYCSLGVHESQSRFWENLVGRSRGFWEFWWPELVSQFPASLQLSEQNEFWQAVNCVQPSLIRVEADEATYNLHIAIRFQLELALISGDLAVADLPQAWNDLYEKNLGLRPANDREGVLQDVHWSAGLFGYFPTYTLGNLYACQLYRAADRELGSLEAQFAKGEFGNVLNWFQTHIFDQGRCWTAPELLERATGESAGATALLQHLQGKFHRIYGL